jgi:hypothetical protein
MRKTAGIALILVGATGLAIYGIVMLRLPVPRDLLSRLGYVVLFVDPAGAPIAAGAFLIAGILLLRRRSKPDLIAKILMRLIAAVALWAAVIAVCFLYSFLHPSLVAYIGLAMLVLWYLYIPFLWCVVSIAWPIVQKLSQLRRTSTAHL